jgi:hypothetical protein
MTQIETVGISAHWRLNNSRVEYEQVYSPGTVEEYLAINGWFKVRRIYKILRLGEECTYWKGVGPDQYILVAGLPLVAHRILRKCRRAVEEHRCRTQHDQLGE